METRRPAVSAVSVGAVVLILAWSPAAAVASGGWMDAHATFYGDEIGAETMRKKTNYSDSTPHQHREVFT
jgi:hypothetical protein